MERRRFALPQKFICLQSIDLEAQQQAQQQQHQQGPGFSAINPKQVIDMKSKITSKVIMFLDQMGIINTSELKSYFVI